MLKTIVISLLVVGALSEGSTTPDEASNNATEGVKNHTAAGHYYGGHGHGRGHGYGYGYPWGPSYDTPIVDDYICDLDATILVVTNSDNDDNNDDNNGGRYKRGNKNDDDSYRGNDNNGYGKGYGRDNDKPNADRLKCSVIASDDTDACSTCCRIAARRDRSISQNDIVGFIVDNDQIDRNQNDDNDNDRRGPYRAKRNPDGDFNRGPPGSSPYHGGRDHDLPRNPLCVCCAPRKFGFPHFRPFHHRHHHRGGY